MILETERLILRRLEETDAQRFSEYRSKEEVARYQSWNSYSVSKAKRRCRHSNKMTLFKVGVDYNLAITLKSSQLMIGDLFVGVLSKNAVSLGYTIDSDYWQLGYATEILEAFFDYLKENKIKKVLCYIYPENTVSKKVLDHFNFKKFSSSYLYGDEGYKKEL